MKSLLEINHLTIEIADDQQQIIPIVEDISFQIPKGKTVGIVGESGSGKSLTAMSILRLLPKNTVRIASGDIVLEDVNLTNLSDKAFRKIRGDEISMIFQEPMTALNPIFKIEQQIVEMLLKNKQMRKKQAKERALTLLQEVGISAPEIVAKSYPHELSGGMRQRVLIAIALASNPKLLIADEPTTALDVTIQAQILLLLKKIQQQGTSILLITHDFGVVSQMCDYICVMYAGKIVEQGPTKQVLNNPIHPYTEALLKSIPQFNEHVETLASIDGHVPIPREFPTGCRFATRCTKKLAICDTVVPPTAQYGDVQCACHLLSKEDAK